jgi:hypothetical protein
MRGGWAERVKAIYLSQIHDSQYICDHELEAVDSEVGFGINEGWSTSESESRWDLSGKLLEELYYSPVFR